jgi:presenilin-like A22 family membrane protease
MNQRTRAYAASLATVGLFLAVQVGALALIQPFLGAGYQAVENPTDPTNSLLYIGALLVFTAAMLGVLRLGQQWVLRWFVIFVSAMLSWYVFAVVVPPVVSVADVNLLALGAAGLVAAGLVFHPEWYVIDAAGIVMGAGAAGLFGISFGVLPAIVLLVVLAVYDAISVYGTEHMLALASGVMDLKIPVILVVPLSLSYSFRELDTDRGQFDGEEPNSDEPNGDEPDGAAEATDESADADPTAESTDAGPTGEAADTEPGPEGKFEADGPEVFEREAFFIGLGDAVMPTVMVASAATFSPAPSLVLARLTVNLPALLAVVGTMVGLLVLLRMVMAGRPHAGLPLLNGGAIGGYLLGAVLAGVPLVEAVGLAPYL